MKEKTDEIVGKIDPKIMARIEELKKKLESLLKKSNSSDVITVRCNGYFREFLRDYDREKFPFAPSDILVDHNGLMSICLGTNRSPDQMEGEVLWFLSEKDKEPHYLSAHTPEHMKKNYSLLLAA